MIKMSRKAKKAMAVALTAGMLASTAVTPVMAATQGWKQNSKGWWYQNADGSYPANKWSLINGKWYYFNANGYMLANSWVPDKAGKWYFVGADGAMKANAWAKDKNGLWYWLTDNGSMFEGGWGHINGEWYFFKNDGVMQSGVVKVDGKTYYLGLPSEGWMQTGKLNIAGTEYNFDKESGACTDAKAPVAAKAFDKTGKEVENVVDIEEVADITGVITNALPDYQAEYGNVLIAGNDAYLKVLVSDENGKPVVGTPVSLTSKLKEEASNSYAFKIKGTNVQITDTNGYATFVIGTESSSVTPTSGDRALLSLTATAVAINKSYKTDVAFASINLGEVDVVNDNKDDDEYLVKPSKNDTSGKIVAKTYSIDSDVANIEYVKSQQVNAKGTTTNKVKLSLDPKINIPYVNTTAVVDKYQQDINQEIKEYSVYQDGGSTSFKVEKVPAGLKYATLNFSSIDISKYTRVEIHPYVSGTTDYPKGITGPYIIDGATTQKDFGYQIPVQKNTSLDVVVKVVSKGQVDDDQNAGLVIKDVTGIYDTKNANSTKVLSLKDSVTWSVVENKYSNDMPMSETLAKTYITDDYDEKYRQKGNTYSYQVPVYPYTGNAILTVKDVNKNVVGYFTIPTYNIEENGERQNENDIVTTARAILVSKDEAFNTVGTITPNGNTVEVNSEAAGITAVQAKIDIEGFEDEINLTNNTVYSSVHWAPIPNAAAQSDDFYALEGQTITVKAQLVDNNGNKVAQSGEDINFTYSKGNVNGVGALPGTNATVSGYTKTTDANGQAELKLTTSDMQALVASLSANSKNFNVQLVIGGTNVSSANLRWVEAGLSFESEVDKTTTEYEYIDTLSETAATPNLTTPLVKDTGSNWILGYKVLGDTNDDTSATRFVTSIKGLNVKLDKVGEGEIATEGLDNGVAKLSSKKAGVTTLTGELNKDSYKEGSEVIFTVATTVNGKTSSKDYKNVGEGTPTLDAALELPINWGTVGTTVDMIAPNGTTLEQGVAHKAYIKVGDNFGAVKAGEDVEITVTYNGKKNGVAKSEKLGYNGKTYDANKNNSGTYNASTKTNGDGLVAVTILKQSDSNISGLLDSIDSVTVTAKVGDISKDLNIVLANVTNKADFALATSKYVYTTGTNPKVELFFTQKVNENTVKAEMFGLTGTTSGKIGIKKVEVDPSDATKVILTLDDQYVARPLDPTDTFTVTVNNVGVDVEGIEYILTDAYGRYMKTAGTDGFKTVSAKNFSVKFVDNDIIITTDGTVDSNEKLICVYNDRTYDLDGSGVNNGILTLASLDTIDDKKGIEDRAEILKPLTVDFYFDGHKVTKTLELTAAETTKVQNNADIAKDVKLVKAALTAAPVYDKVNKKATFDLSAVAKNETTLTLSGSGSALTISDTTKIVDISTASSVSPAQNFTVQVAKGTGSTVILTASVTVDANGVVTVTVTP